ncbi:MAG: CDP-alcohol phosphatidyltransferase family protein [Verrucomicrobiae bacterium]|nr:CDP-alcohol phosphatidyltransferase family protein [Verrucomicrobiae bacterium]
MGAPGETARVMTVANRITIVRILLIPVFILLLVYYIDGARHGSVLAHLKNGALAVFLVASLSDALDGFIARRCHQATRLGRVLDPIADKLLVGSAIVLLSIWEVPGLHRFPLWFPVLIFSRDLMLLIGSAVLHVINGHVEVRPHRVGKASTAMNLTAIVAAMLDAPWLPCAPIVWIAGGLTACSAFLYFSDGIAQLHRPPGGRP